MLNKKTYFISDIHLGAPALKNNQEREKLFVQWLNEVSVDASAIYLLGDVFDFWYEYRKVVPRGFVRTLGAIARITDSGIPVYFFTGNHDIWAFDYLQKETGMVVYHNPIVKEINNHRFFLAHGDGLDLNDKGYLLMNWFFKNRVAQFLFSRLHPNFSFWLGQSWSKDSRISKGIEGEEYKGEDKESMVIFAKKYSKENDVDFLVFGHRHIMLDIEVAKGVRLINLGDWITHFSYAVYDGEKIELLKYKINHIDK